VFGDWFRMVERCPRCQYRFDREEGFFLGAFVVNFGLTVALLAVAMAVMIAVLAGGGSSRTLSIVAAAAVIETICVPVLFYPSSKTTWAAIDLALHRGEVWGVDQKGVDQTGVDQNGVDRPPSRPR
jgi:hypothetical protein